MESEVVSMAPWIGVISQLVGWTFFIICLGIFKNFLSNGFSMAIGEFLLKQATQEQREKICRWFGNGPAILEAVKETKSVMEGEKDE